MADENNGSTIIIKKIKKGGHGHHGGAWKVAYADFVTAMMAFFLTMWIMGMSQDKKEGIQRYFNDPLKYLFGSPMVFTGLFEGSMGKMMISTGTDGGGNSEHAGKGSPNRMRLLAQQIEADLVPSYKDSIFEFEARADNVQFAITAEALFSPGSALLRPEAEPVLEKTAQLLKASNAFITIAAHTDDLRVDSPTIPTNWELSALRAATVARYFVEGHYFDPTKIKVVAAADTQPIADNRTPAGRARNRRVDFLVSAEDGGTLNFNNTSSDSVRQPASK